MVDEAVPAGGGERTATSSGWLSGILRILGWAFVAVLSVASVYSLWNAYVFTGGPYRTPDVIGVDLVLLVTVPLLWVRRDPVLVSLVVTASATALVVLDFPLGWWFGVPLIAGGSVVALRRLRWPPAAAAWGLMVVGYWAIGYLAGGDDERELGTWLAGLSGVCTLVAAGIWRLLSRRRARRRQPAVVAEEGVARRLPDEWGAMPRTLAAAVREHRPLAGAIVVLVVASQVVLAVALSQAVPSIDEVAAWTDRPDATADIAGMAPAPDGGLVIFGGTAEETESGDLANSDLHLRRYDHAGKVVWTRATGIGGDDRSPYALAVATGADGSIAVIASYVRIEGDRYLDEPAHIVVQFYDAAGERLWEQEVGRVLENGPYPVVTDGFVAIVDPDWEGEFTIDWFDRQGEAVATKTIPGYLSARAVAGPDDALLMLVEDDDTPEVAVVRTDPGDDTETVVEAGVIEPAASCAVAAGEDGSLVVTSAAFANRTFVPAATTTSLTKFDADGEEQWSIRRTSPGTSYQQVAIDGNGTLTVLGRHQPTVLGRLPAGPVESPFALWRFDRDGTQLGPVKQFAAPPGGFFHPREVLPDGSAAFISVEEGDREGDFVEVAEVITVVRAD